MQIFNGRGNFSLWQQRMLDMLIFHNYDEVLSDERPAEITEREWRSLDKKASSMIRLCLGPDSLNEIKRDFTASVIWKKLESVYKGKGLTLVPFG